MKKIFTMLVFAAGTVSFAAAQSHNDKNIAYNNDKMISNDHDEHYAFDKAVGFNDNYFSLKEKQAKIEKINKEYDKKIAAVKSNRRLSGREKTKQIQFLQMQKQKEIDQVEFEYAKSQKGKSRSNGHDAHW
ncbi:hypothetical protein [Ferruginibacter sp.]